MLNLKRNKLSLMIVVFLLSVSVVWALPARKTAITITSDQSQTNLAGYYVYASSTPDNWGAIGISASDGTASNSTTFTSATGGFNPDVVGNYITIGTTNYLVTAYNSSTSITINAAITASAENWTVKLIATCPSGNPCRKKIPSTSHKIDVKFSALFGGSLPTDLQFFVTTIYDANNFESDYSNQVGYYMPTRGNPGVTGYCWKSVYFGSCQ